MKLRRVNRQADGPVLIYPFLLIMGMLVIAGCGGYSDSGKIEYSQKFEMPDGATTNSAPDPNQPVLSRSQRRRKEIEESRAEAAQKPTKGKRGRR